LLYFGLCPAYKKFGGFQIQQAVEKVIFFSDPYGLTRAKYYPQACLKQTGVFLKNNKPKPLMA